MGRSASEPDEPDLGGELEAGLGPTTLETAARSGNGASNTTVTVAVRDGSTRFVIQNPDAEIDGLLADSLTYQVPGLNTRA